jgi:glycosyltransferase involved in cell wall biosynthesis
VLPRDLVPMRGWALFPDGPPAHVELWLGDRSLGPARLGGYRPDVDAEYGTGGVISQYELVADLRGWDGPLDGAEVRAVATGVGGQRVASRPARVHAAPARPAPAPQPQARRPTLARTGRPRGDGSVRVLVFTHNLDLGGAQTYLLELLRGLRDVGGLQCTLVSPCDGVLRRPTEELGVDVHVTSPFPMDDGVAFDGRVDELAAWAAPGRFDVVVVNTALAYPGGAVAERLGIPAVWAIHESYDPGALWSLYGDALSPDVRARADAALARAAAGIFEAEATRDQYAAHLGGPALALPYGLDLASIDAARATVDPDAARHRCGIAPGERVVLCLGTVEPRKAQAPLAQAFGLVAGRHRDARLAIVGGRDDEPTRCLREYTERYLPDGRVDVHPLALDVASWFAVADLLVCASDVESLPRTVLEAMGWEVPVLATAIFGLPELIDHGTTGWLCPPRDVGALASALDDALSLPAAERARVGAAGRELVERRHALAPYARTCARLLADVAAGEAPTVAGVAASAA